MELYSLVIFTNFEEIQKESVSKTNPEISTRSDSNSMIDMYSLQNENDRLQ